MMKWTTAAAAVLLTTFGAPSGARAAGVDDDLRAIFAYVSYVPANPGFQNEGAVVTPSSQCQNIDSDLGYGSANRKEKCDKANQEATDEYNKRPETVAENRILSDVGRFNANGPWKVMEVQVPRKAATDPSRGSWQLAGTFPSTINDVKIKSGKGFELDMASFEPGGSRKDPRAGVPVVAVVWNKAEMSCRLVGDPQSVRADVYSKPTNEGWLSFRPHYAFDGDRPSGASATIACSVLDGQPHTVSISEQTTKKTLLAMSFEP